MDVPGIVEEALDGEEVAASVDLGGDDALFVTPTRTLIYRSEGLLSDESVESYSHEAESLSLSEGRRKTRITLDHPIDGVEEFTLPSSAADEAIPSILAGILGMNDVLGEDEGVVDTYLFSELTLVVADNRLVKHVGETVWDLDFEEYPFADVTGVYAEQGSVATQLVIEIDGRAERIKTPSDRAREVRETLEGAIRRFHGLRPEEDLNDALAPEEPADADDSADATDGESGSSSGMDFGEGVDPLSAGDTTQDGRNPDPNDLEREVGSSNPAESSADTADSDEPAAASDAGAPASGQAARDDEPASTAAEDTQTTAKPGTDDKSEDAGGSSGQPSVDATTPDGTEASTPADAPSGEPAHDDLRETDVEQASDPSEELAEEVAELRVAVQKQNKLLTRQHKTIQKLVEELRRGR
ncbi:hypothetical protein GCM10028857_02460 [Salinarchaeum chitinilyticum]